MLSLSVDVPDDYVPSDGEVDNLVYLTLKYGAGWPMRGCDLTIVKMMAGNVRGSAGLSRLVYAACEYAWDHILGEPDGVTSEDMFGFMKPILEEWYSKTSQEERSVTS